MIGLYEKLCIMIDVMKISVNFKKIIKTNNKKIMKKTKK
jgi:hypothetical protein